jgi:hypothetical protein
LLAILGLAELAIATVYLLTHEFREIAPAMFEGIVVGPAHRWITCAKLVVFGMVAFAYLQVRTSQPAESRIDIILPRSTLARWIRPILVLSVYSLAGILAYMAILEDFMFRPTIWSELLSYALYTNYYLPVAVWVTAVDQLVCCWRHRKRGSAVTIVGLPRTQFATIATLSVALGIAGSVVLVWTSFALWLTPWYELP